MHCQLDQLTALTQIFPDPTNVPLPKIFVTSENKTVLESSIGAQPVSVAHGTLQESYQIGSTFLCNSKEVLDALARCFPGMGMNVWCENVPGKFPNISPKWWIVLYDRPAYFAVPGALRTSHVSDRFDVMAAITRTGASPETNRDYLFFSAIQGVAQGRLLFQTPASLVHGTHGTTSQAGNVGTSNQVALAPIRTRSAAPSQDMSASSSHGTHHSTSQVDEISASSRAVLPLRSRLVATSQDMPASSSYGTPSMSSVVDNLSTAPTAVAASPSTPRVATIASTPAPARRKRTGRGEVVREPRMCLTAVATAPQGVYKSTRGSVRKAKVDALEAWYRQMLGYLD